jgi:hypothetical protein
MAAQPMSSLQPDRVPFEAAAPRVTLRNHFSHPYDSAIAAARTCYAPRIWRLGEVASGFSVGTHLPMYTDITLTALMMRASLHHRRTKYWRHNACQKLSVFLAASLVL